MVFLGRICPEKRLDRAIEIVTRAGVQLKIAAKVDKVDEEYFASEIKPLLNTSLVEVLGEINDDQKNLLLGGARALLFPIDWPEPFGLLMIEALACGTPVITFECGYVPEVIEHGKTAFVVHNVSEAVHALERIETISRHICRKEFAAKYRSVQMAPNYLSVYHRLRRGTHLQRVDGPEYVTTFGAHSPTCPHSGHSVSGERI